MELRIKRSLCIAGCLSVLMLPTIGTADAHGTFFNGKSYQKIINSGMITGAASTINNIMPGDTYTVDADSVGSVGDIENQGALINDYNVIVNTLTNTGTVSGNSGTLSISKGGSNSGTGSSIAQNILEFTGTNQTFTNSSSIDATTRLTNNGTFNNNTNGSITTALLENTKTFTNNAAVDATNITNSSRFTNNASGSLTANKITNTAGTFTNKQANASISEIDNQSGAEYKNEAENTVTKVTNAGTFTNTADLTAGTLTNSSTFTNNGAEVNVTGTFTNSATGNITGNGDLTVKDGSNAGTISQGNVNVNGVFTNSKDLTATTKLTNGGTFTNAGGAVINSATLENTNEFTNSGTIGSSSKKVNIINSGSKFDANGTVYANKITNKSGGKFSNKSTSNSIVEIENQSGATYSNEVASTVNKIVNGGTFTNTADLTAGTLTNDSLLTNNGAEVNVTGTFTNSATGSLTGTGDLTIKDGSNAGTISQGNVSVSGVFTNSKDLTATTKLTNNGTFNNNTNGSITTALLENTKTFTNNAAVDATSITNSSRFTNNASGSLTANKITNTAGTFTNKQANASISEIDNQSGAEYKNEAENTVTKVTNAGTFTNTAKLTATTVDNSKTFSNTSDLVAWTLNNTGNNAQLTGSGNLTVSGGTNSGTISQNNVTVSGAYTNNKNLTSNGIFSNVGGAITGDGDLTVKNGASSASISQKNVTINGDFDVESAITAAQNFTIGTSADVENKAAGSIIANAIINNNSFTNSGTLGSTGKKVAITNNGTMSIESGTLYVSSITNKANKSFTNKVASTFDSITNEAGATYNNDANTTVGSVTNSGIFNNSAEVNVTGAFANNNANAKFSGGTLNLASGGTNSGTVGAAGKATTVNVNGGTFTNNNSVTNTTLKVANGAGLTNNGNITNSNTTIDAGGSLTNIANHTISGGTVVANGKLDNKGTITGGSTVTINGSGSDASTNSGSIFGSTVNVAGSLTNNGNITSSNTTIDAGGSLTNTANHTISGGTVVANGKLDNQGTINGAATVTVNGSGANASTNSGTISASNVNVKNNGSFTNSGNIVSTSQVTVDSGSTFTNTATGDKSINGSTITANGKFDNQGKVVNSTITLGGTTEADKSTNSGSITGSTVNVETGVTFDNSNTITNSNTTVKNGATLNNTGSINGSGNLAVTGTVNNEGSVGGSLNLTINNGGVVNVGNTTEGKTASVNTSGKITISDGAKLNITEGGSATLKSGDDWSGAVSNTDGTLNIASGDFTGNDYTQSGGNLNITGGSFELADGSTITDGTVTVNGGEFSLATGSSMTGGNVDIISGTIGVSGTIEKEAGLVITDGINYRIKENGSITLDSDNDIWSGTGKVQLTDNTSIFDFQGTKNGTNGVLEADAGKLLVNSDLTIGTNSRILSAVETAINKDITISSGSVELNDNDTWAADATVTQTGGSLSIEDYDKTTQGQGTLIASGGNLSIEDSIIDIVGNSKIEDGSNVKLTGSTINVKDGGSVVLSGTGDSWTSGQINLGENGKLDYNLTSNGTGVLNATDGLLNVNGGTLTLDNSSLVAEAVETHIKGNVAVTGTGANKSELNLNTDDTWTSGVITVEQDGVFNYKDITSTGTLVAKDGTFNLESGNLTLTSGGRTDAGIAAEVDATIGGNLTIKDNVAVNLDDSTKDSWTGNITLDGGTLDYSLNSNGKLTADKGELNVNDGTLTLDNSSLVAEAVETHIKGNVAVTGTGANKSVLNLNTSDTWTSGVITVEQDGVFNYKEITSTGTLVAKDGTFNFESGNLTLVNPDNVADAGIAAEVDATIKGNLTIKDNVAVNLDDSTNDLWDSNATITLDGGSLDYSLNTNGALHADKGNLTVSDGLLTLKTGSYVKDDVVTAINKDVLVSGGELNLNDKDTWAADAKVTLNGGKVNYADLTSNGIFQGVKGELNTEKGSTLNIVGTDNNDNAAYIKSDVAATINGDLVIGSNGTVDLGKQKESDAQDTVIGNVTVNDGGTLNIFNDLNFKPVKPGEYSDQLITIKDGGKMNLNTTGELHLYPNLAGAGPVDKNGEGDVWFHGNFDDYTGSITIKNGGDLLFEQGLGGNLVIGEKVDGKGLTIGIHADDIEGSLIQERDITMKYSTYHDDRDLNLAMNEDSVIKVTKGAIIAESKGDNNINIGGSVTIKPEDGLEKPVSMTATSNGSINFNNDVDVTEATMNLTSGVDTNFAKDLTISDATMNLTSGNNSNFANEVSVAGSTINLNSGNKANFDNKVSITDSTMNLITGDSANFNANTILNGSHMNVVSGNLNFNNLIFEGNNSTIHDMNGEINNNTIQNLDIYDRGYADFTVDVNGRDWQHDKFVISDVTTMDGGQINVSDWQFADDWNRTGKAPIDRNIIMNMFDVSKIPADKLANINFTQTDKEIFTPIGWYKLENYMKWNKQLGAAESVPGVLQASLSRYNPQVFRGQVSTLAMYNNQLLIDDMLTNHVGLQSERFLNPNANKYALSEGNYVGPYQYTQENGGLWMKNFVSFEKLSMTQNLRVGNNFYGTLIGADMPVVNLKQGWKLVPTAYIGYNGSHQYYDNVSMYQNGAQLGFMGTFMKNDFIGSALVYGGTYFNDMKLNGYNEDTMSFFVGTAAKAAYNLHPTKHFTVQPNLFVSYNYFGKQSWHSNFGDMTMNSGVLNGVNVAPGLNLIYARETWSLYATFQYMYNINDDLTGKAGNVLLHNVQMRHGYFQYGIGMTKTWKDRMNSFFQVVLRNGGRTGIGFQLGAQYLFDWHKPAIKKEQKTQPVEKHTIKAL